MTVYPIPQVAGESRRGLRPANQDRIFCEEAEPGRPQVIGLADGMGGHESGDRAAELAIEQVSRFSQELRATPPEELTNAAIACSLEVVFHKAHDRIKAAAAKTGAAKAMGTTLVVAVIWNGRLAIGHTGDSRAYRVSPEEITPLTRDHTVIVDLIEAGKMTEEAATRSPLQHLLTYALGHTLHVDMFPAQGETEEHTPPYDVLLSSDGVHGSLTSAEIQDTLLVSPDPAEGCSHLIDLALERGSTDNVSVVLARVEP